MSKLLHAFTAEHKRFILTLPFLTVCSAAAAAAAVSYIGYSPDKAGYADPDFRPCLLLVPFVCASLLLAVFTAFSVTHKTSGSDEQLTPVRNYIVKLMLSLYGAFLLLIFTAVPMLIFGYKNCFSDFEAVRIAELLLLCFVMMAGFSSLFVFLSSVIKRTAVSVIVCTATAAMLISVTEMQLHYLGQPEFITSEHTTEEAVYSEELGKFELRSKTETQYDTNPQYLGSTLETAVKYTYLLDPARCMRIAFESSQYPKASELREAITQLRDETLTQAQKYPKRLLKAAELSSTLSAVLITLSEAAVITVAGVLIARRKKI